MTPHVIDVDQRGAAMQGSHSADRKVVGTTKVVGDLISRCDQCAKGATPHCPAIRRTFYKSPSLFDDLYLERLRHDDALSLQIPFVNLFLP